jgi:hypothetical protein
VPGINEEAYYGFLKPSIEVTHPLSTSLGCVGQPEEVVESISFLVSGEAKLMCLMFAHVCKFLGTRILPLFVGQTLSLHYYHLTFVVLTYLAYLIAVNTSYRSPLGNTDPGKSPYCIILVIPRK